MRGYLNRCAKIKWENTPADPEFTDERIKKVIDANVPPFEVTTPANGDILSYDSTSEKWVNAEPPAEKLDDLTDVELSGTITAGSILRAQSTGQNPNWKNARLALQYKPVTSRDVTADGNTDSYTFDVMDTSNDFAYKSLGILFDLSLNAGSEQTNLTVEVSTNGTDFTSVGAISNAVSTTGSLKSKVYGIQLIGAFMSFFGSPTVAGVHSIQTRYDGIFVDANTVKYVRFKLANAANFPADSTIKLTLIQWDI